MNKNSSKEHPIFGEERHVKLWDMIPSTDNVSDMIVHGALQDLMVISQVGEAVLQHQCTTKSTQPLLMY